MRQTFLLWAAAISAANALAVGPRVVVESLPSVPEGWRRLRDAAPRQQIKLKIALEQPNLAEFEKTLFDVSDPQHVLYGRHLKRDELKDLMRPSRESTDAVLAWLRESGIPNSMIEDDGDWIDFKVTVGQANKMLNTTFAVYGHDHVERIRALKYSVPAKVASHITMVAPIIRFGQVRRMRSLIVDNFDEGIAAKTLQAAQVPNLDLNATACNATMTPECLRALYKIGDYKAAPVAGSLLGICGYLEEYARYSELAKFEEVYAPYAKGANFSVVSINGGGNNQTDTVHDSGEANLDMQYALGISYNTPVVYYSTGGRGPLVPDLDEPDENSNEPYLDFVTYMLNLPDDKLPQTLTTSYGEPEQTVPKAFNLKVCQMFGQLGARGVSVLFSSGDEGPGSSCQTNDGKYTTRFQATFPGACPYVTSVGSTRYVQPEQAVSFSSGGFSDIHPQPSYQAGAVQGYLQQLGDRWKGLYNPAGRGFPDVAAQGVRYHVFDSGNDSLISGTSASAPMFAGLVSLLNSARLQAGQPPMGFLNPWIYSKGSSGFTDVTLGGSRGCSGTSAANLTSSFVPYASWNATPGWDPVTGLGTPLFDKMLELSSPGGQLPKIGKPHDD